MSEKQRIYKRLEDVFGPVVAAKMKRAASKPAKVRITIFLDHDILEHARKRAGKGTKYQTYINETLRQSFKLKEP